MLGRCVELCDIFVRMQRSPEGTSLERTTRAVTATRNMSQGRLFWRSIPLALFGECNLALPLLICALARMHDADRLHSLTEVAAVEFCLREGMLERSTKSESCPREESEHLSIIVALRLTIGLACPESHFCSLTAQPLAASTQHQCVTARTAFLNSVSQVDNLLPVVTAFRSNWMPVSSKVEVISMETGEGGRFVGGV
jgi:hypothetical protein